MRAKIERIFNIWGDRGIYDKEFVKILCDTISKYCYFVTLISGCNNSVHVYEIVYYWPTMLIGLMMQGLP